MAIFQKTEPGLLYELSPGRDGRLLVWSPGLMKYKDCTTLEELADVNSNYLEQDIDDGCWFYQLPSLVNGDNMFYNDVMTELYEGRVPLWHFESNLQSLQSGVNMFKGCSLDAASVKRIADTLSDAAPGTITLGIHYSLEGDSSVAASLAKIANKGWSVEVEYNLPYGYTSLDYLESNGVQYIDSVVPLADDTVIDCTAIAIKANSNYMLFGVRDTADTKKILGMRAQPSSGEIPLVTALIGDTDTDNTYDYERYWFNIPLGTLLTIQTVGVKSATLNGALRTSNFQEAWGSSKLHIGIFATAYNTENRFEWRGHYKLFTFKISDKTGMLRDFIPALDPSGTPGLFDKITKRMYYNKGKGVLGYQIKGSDVSVAPTIDYTELEYLEASGTQCIETGLTVNASNGASVEWSMNTKTDYANVLSVNNADAGGTPINPGGFVVPYWNAVAAPFLAVFMNQGENNYALDEEVQLATKYVSNLNWLNDHKITLNNELMGSIPEDVTSYACANPVLFGSSRNGALFYAARLNGKIYRARISEDAEIIHDFIPVLIRKTTTVTEGTTTSTVTEHIPGMYDKVTGQFYENNGSGTFGYRIKHNDQTVAPRTLVDPYYVAPSGIYARLVAENELDIVADTDMTADIAEQDGYIWFANTGEAYEHFGVTQQPEEGEVIDA